VPFLKTTLILFLLPLLCLAEAAPLYSDHSDPRQQIEKILGSPQAEVMQEPIVMLKSLREIYQLHDYEPLWINEEKVLQMAAVLEDSVEYGFRPADYHLLAIRDLLEVIRLTRDPSAVAALDVVLSDGLILYIQHRRYGKVRPRDLYPEFNLNLDKSDHLPPMEVLQRAIASENLAAFIDNQSPDGGYYELFRQQLIRYRGIASSGGWPSVPLGPTLRKADRDPRIPAIRKRLQVTGELAASASGEDELFDEELAEAVARFQSLHGLVTDGIAGKQTLSAMNVAVGTRIDQLRLSLERLRWIEQDTDDELIAVNIASFRLFYVKGQNIVWTTRVIVGTPYRSTPVFRSLMTYVEFNPGWTIPPTILREDTLPAIRKNPDYLASRNILVFDHNNHEIDPATIDWNNIGKNFPYSLRQEPGPENALGLVKFIFPNPYFVYMHDTPHRELFDRPQRSYSSGCIRVEDPFRLVELVLKERQNFTPVELEEILRSGRTQRVLLEEPLPVMILYLTAAVDVSGVAQFYQDIYDRDPAVLSLLDGPVSAVDR
jgi:murein L,D-transpeptidase YcbB/YkuD